MKKFLISLISILLLISMASCYSQANQDLFLENNNTRDKLDQGQYLEKNELITYFQNPFADTDTKVDSSVSIRTEYKAIKIEYSTDYPNLVIDESKMDLKVDDGEKSIFHIYANIYEQFLDETKLYYLNTAGNIDSNNQDYKTLISIDEKLGYSFRDTYRSNNSPNIDLSFLDEVDCLELESNGSSNYNNGEISFDFYDGTNKDVELNFILKKGEYTLYRTVKFKILSERDLFISEIHNTYNGIFGITLKNNSFSTIDLLNYELVVLHDGIDSPLSNKVYSLSGMVNPFSNCLIEGTYGNTETDLVDKDVVPADYYHYTYDGSLKYYNNISPDNICFSDIGFGDNDTIKLVNNTDNTVIDGVDVVANKQQYRNENPTKSGNLYQTSVFIEKDLTFFNQGSSSIRNDYQIIKVFKNTDSSLNNAELYVRSIYEPLTEKKLYSIDFKNLDENYVLEKGTEIKLVKQYGEYFEVFLSFEGCYVIKNSDGTDYYYEIDSYANLTSFSPGIKVKIKGTVNSFINNYSKDNTISISIKLKDKDKYILRDIYVSEELANTIKAGDDICLTTTTASNVNTYIANLDTFIDIEES